MRSMGEWEQSPLNRRMTEEEFLRLPESHERIELVDGEVILSPSPSPLHQRIVQLLHDQLRAWEKLHPPAMVGLAPLDVRLAHGRIVQPDLFVCVNGYPLDRSPVDVVPTLTIEVLSAQSTYDRFAKRLLYAQAGVKEYWLVDPYARSVEQVAGLETVAVEQQAVTSQALTEFRVDLDAVFAPISGRH